MIRRPNILIVLNDQHRWDCLGVAGNPEILTPELDRLATEGVCFDEAYCPYPLCTPARYSMLTSLYAHQHGVLTNRATLAPGHVTFPRLLRAAGYQTRAVGKMHFTPTYLDVGFDSLALAEQAGDGRLDDDYHGALVAAGRLDVLDLMDQCREFRDQAPPDYWATYGARRTDLPPAWHSTTWIGDRAVETLEQWTAGGNLLMAGFIKPHHPFDPPAPYDTLYDPEQLTPRPGWTESRLALDQILDEHFFPYDTLTEAVLRRVMALYYGTITHIDAQIGRMLDTLRRRGLYDDTLVLFTADHGEYLGFHHLLLKGNWPYDPLLRVPLLVKFPGQREGGARRQDLVSLLDVAPTILRQAGLAIPPVMTGADLAVPSGRDLVFGQYRAQFYFARSSTHKLVLAPDRQLFFSLRDDPHELTDRSADPACRAVLEAHRAALFQWLLFDAPPVDYTDPTAPAVAPDDRPPPTPTARQARWAAMTKLFAKEQERLTPPLPQTGA